MNDPMFVGALGVVATMVLLMLAEQALLWYSRRAKPTEEAPDADVAAGLDDADAAMDSAKAAISVARERLTAKP